MIEGGTNELDLERLLRQRGWLRALAAGLVRPGEVDDLVQESWLAALCSSPPRRSMRGWLAGLARNAARRTRRGPGVKLDCATLADGRAPAHELLARAELQERLIAAVRALREPYRSTVLLHYFEELSLERVARRTGVPASTARTRLARALAELRHRLADERGGALPAFLVELARHGGASASSTVLEVTVMGTLLKVGAGVGVAAAAAALVWTRVHDEERASGSSAERSPRVIASARSPEAPVPAPAAPATELVAPPAPEPHARLTPGLSSVAVVEAAAEPVAPPSPLERSLDAIAETFLTAQPDVVGLLAVSADLAGSARVLPETIEVDADTGRIAGELVLGGGLKGSFSIDGSAYEIEVDAAGSRAPYFLRALNLRFSDVDGSVQDAHATVQYHPDTRASAEHTIGAGEHLVGWSLAVDPTAGTSVHPLTMQAEGRAWRIGGTTRAFEPLAFPWATGTNAFELWHARLQPHRR